MHSQILHFFTLMSHFNLMSLLHSGDLCRFEIQLLIHNILHSLPALKIFSFDFVDLFVQQFDFGRVLFINFDNFCSILPLDCSHFGNTFLLLFVNRFFKLFLLAISRTFLFFKLLFGFLSDAYDLLAQILVFLIVFFLFDKGFFLEPLNMI